MPLEVNYPMCELLNEAMLYAATNDLAPRTVQDSFLAYTAAAFAADSQLPDRPAGLVLRISEQIAAAARDAIEHWIRENEHHFQAPQDQPNQ
jgi:hypothetical protein